MLKKFKNFLLGLTLVFSCLLTGKFVAVENKIYAASEQTPTLEETGGENWSYNGDVLTLKGVDWSGMLVIENDLTIILNGDNKICADDVAIYSGGSLTFSGEGSLELTGSPVFSCSEVNFGENQKVIVDSNSAILGSEATGLLDASYVKIFTAEASVYGESGTTGEGGTSSEPSTTTKGSVTISTPNDEAGTTTVSTGDLNLSENLKNNSYDLTKVFTCTEGSGDKTYYYKKSGETDWTSIARGSKMPVSEAGTYNVKVVVAENDAYQAAEKEHELVITKANIKVKLILADWIYGYYADRNSNGEEVHINSLDNSHSFKINYTLEFYSNSDLADEHKIEGTPVNAGTYYPVVRVPETGLTNAATNLTNDESGNIKVITVSPREITNDIVWSGENENFTYTYNAQTRAITAHWVKTDTPDGTDGDLIEFNVTISEDTTNSTEFKNAGTYTATIVSFKIDQPNYALPSATADSRRTKSYTINKIAFTINVESKSKIFNDEPSTWELTSKCVGGEVVDYDTQGQPIKLYELSMTETITKQTAIGKYPIVATLTNVPEQVNYDITINNNYYYVVNKILNIQASNWIYGGLPSTPSAASYLEEKEITYSYYKTEFGKLVKLDDVPTEPGYYQLKAEVVDDEIYNRAEAMASFYILKISVTIPAEDKTIYTYDGTYKVYNIVSRDIYTIDNFQQKDAGTYKVRLTLKDTDHYEWAGRTNAKFIEYKFVINKKQVRKPSETPVIYKYTGSPISYTLADNADYWVSSNSTQTEPGTYKITISLSDKNNTEWNDGTQTDLEREFVIYSSMITNPVTVDYDGKNLSGSPVTLVDASGNGVAPDLSLSVKVASFDDEETINSVKEELGENIKKYDKIFVVYNVSLTDGSETKQPEGLVTLKMKVPSELNGAKFKLFHIYSDANGNQTVEVVDYDGVSEDGYIIVQTNKLSEFVFVYGQSSLVPLIVLFAVLSAALIALLVLQIIMLSKKKPSAALAAAVPVFFVKGEVAASIVLGVIFGLLVTANIVLFILLLKKKKSKKTETTGAVKVKEETIETTEEKTEDVQETEEIIEEINPEEVVELKTRQANTTGAKKKSNKAHSKKN